MPRLSFWAVGILAGFGVTYGGYYHLYLTQRAAQLAADQRWEQSKMSYQEVIRAYSQLQRTIEQQAVIASSFPSSSVNARPDTSAWHTNGEKICFFCDVQRMRVLLLGLPHHLITEKDLRAKLQQLSVWESQHCTELNFRSASPSLSERFRSAACFVIYLLCFRVLSPLLRVWDNSGDWQSWFQHSVSARIVEALEIKVMLTAEDKVPLNGSSEDACVRPQGYITLNTTHWIEEVGFWACPNNPLLHRGPANPPAGVGRHGVDNCHLELLYGLPIVACSSNTVPHHGCASSFTLPALRQRLYHLFLCGPSASATAYTTTYVEQWRRLEALQQERTPSRIERGKETSLIAATDVSLGYPLLSSIDQLECAVNHEAYYIPVGISGWPHVVYVDAAHAKPDVRPRRTREETYARVQQAQFSHVPSAVSVKHAPADLAIAAAPQAPSRLHKWQAYRGFPCWSQAWWGGVYGGNPRHLGTTLHYHLGSSSTVAEYPSAAIAASRAAETFAAASTSPV